MNVDFGVKKKIVLEKKRSGYGEKREGVIYGEEEYNRCTTVTRGFLNFYFYFCQNPCRLSIWHKIIIKMRQVSFDRVKIKGSHDFSKELKLGGTKVLFPKLGDQNRNFWKPWGQKCILP